MVKKLELIKAAFNKRDCAMLNYGLNVKECDATEDDSSNADQRIKKTNEMNRC